MKYAIRALGWATAALWIVVILFSGTVVYSAMQIGMDFGGEPEMAVSNGEMTMSIPFSISNGGLYDISKLNITTFIAAENETVISRSTTTVPLISRGDTVNETHDISISLEDIVAKNLTYMLFNDINLSVGMLVGLTYANAIPLTISTSLPMPWGAPLSNLTTGEPSYTAIGEPPSIQVTVPLSFENHAFFGLNGTISLEIADSSHELVGSGTTDKFDIPPQTFYSTSMEVIIIGDIGDIAEMRLYFDTSTFSFGPVVIPIE